MLPIETQVLQLQAQVNAMAQAWLYLAANIEMQSGIKMEGMESALRKKHWPRDAKIDQEARAMLDWLCGELADARAARPVRPSGDADRTQSASPKRSKPRMRRVGAFSGVDGGIRCKSGLSRFIKL